jgi:glucose-6-phosphate 1-dehydrogenase
MIERLVILGGTSDVVGRLVMPALVDLAAADTLPDAFEVVAVARADDDDDAYRARLREALDEFAPETGEAAREALLDRVRYHQADTTDVDALRPAIEAKAAMVVYLALPPAVFAPTIDALDEIGLAPGSRIVVEKPFGEDLDDARALNERLHAAFAEDAIHRMDHFLGMQMVQNLLALRFANRIFEPVWNAEHIERIDIVWDETLTLEGRAGFYDGTGALKDMLQNHLLQVLALVAMEAPATLGEADLRGRKVELLRQVRIVSSDEAAERSRRARYVGGRIGDREVSPYVEEDGVDPDLATETFAEVELDIDSPRWREVPFRLRTGKALGADRREVVVAFRAVEDSPFESVPCPGNELRIELEPEHVHLRFNVRASSDEIALEIVEVGQGLAAADVAAYGRVLRSVLEGDPRLSIRHDEAELSWEIMTPVLEAWNAADVPMEEYPAGSSGPGAASSDQG